MGFFHVTIYQNQMRGYIMKKLVLSKENLIILGACASGIAFVKDFNLFGITITESNFNLIEGNHFTLTFLKDVFEKQFKCDHTGRITMVSGECTVKYNDTGFVIVYPNSGFKVKREYTYGNDYITHTLSNGDVDTVTKIDIETMLVINKTIERGSLKFIYDNNFMYIYYNQFYIRSIPYAAFEDFDGLDRYDVDSIITEFKINITEDGLIENNHVYKFNEYNQVIEYVNGYNKNHFYKRDYVIEDGKLLKIINQNHICSSVLLDLTKFWKNYENA